MIHVWLAGSAGNAFGDARYGIVLRSRTDIRVTRPAHLLPPVARLDLAAVLIEDAGWAEAEVIAGISEALAILGQCGIGATRITLMRVTAPRPFHDLSTRASEILAATLAAPRPTLFFVRDTRRRPAFEAEAFGRENTGSRPALEHSVWITRQAPDLPETLAHELYHVLANSGHHEDDPMNLMHEDTAPGRRFLRPEQCAAMLAAGQESGLWVAQ